MSGANGIFTASFPLSLGNTTPGDGALSVSDGDQITVTYQDASPAVTLTAAACVNISGPADLRRARHLSG